jgi:hypothetical protein
MAERGGTGDASGESIRSEETDDERRNDARRHSASAKRMTAASR